jgi:hypothetical protein
MPNFAGPVPRVPVPRVPVPRVPVPRVPVPRVPVPRVPVPASPRTRFTRETATHRPACIVFSAVAKCNRSKSPKSVKNSTRIGSATGQVNRCEDLGYGTGFVGGIGCTGWLCHFFGPNVEPSRAYSVHLGDRWADPSHYYLSIIPPLQPAQYSIVSRKSCRTGSGVTPGFSGRARVGNHCHTALFARSVATLGSSTLGRGVGQPVLYTRLI